MLNQRLDIQEAQLPLLVTMPDDTWHLVIRIEKVNESFRCTCIRQQDDSIQNYFYEITDTPFHVGSGIWELGYGCEVMTLLDDSLISHPAMLLWKQWSKDQ
tara:strand:+ start:584 stop:886 length:303 start_codon:yes stop_codon:yes gene_type:complete